jgi:hypothetical protein
VSTLLAAIFKIPTESPQPARGKAASRALNLVAAQPKAARRVAGIETRAATRGDGEVIELDLGITVYPPRDKGGRWRAIWHEDGERQQCESVSEEKLAANLEKVRQRLSTGAASISPVPGRRRPKTEILIPNGSVVTAAPVLLGPRHDRPCSRPKQDNEQLQP